MSNWIEGVRERIAAEFEGHPWVCVMATSDSTGHPTARCMVCYDIDKSGRLIFGTDRRAGEEDDVRACPETEIAFYLRGEQAQVRIRGTAAVLDAETDVFMRETLWEQLSDRVQSMYTNDPGRNQDGSTMPATFELLVVSPTQVEVRELGQTPGEKRVWQDGTTDWATASAI
jgi:general stress protein 26